ncbi:hypothetical protein L3Y34_013720 [Caenorhabditis briggsae]|nr:hypothetical protein L3Y34_013720 [Caenorhabditis briggsae]
MEQQHQQDAPEHMVPVLLEDIADTTTDTIQFSKISLVRVQLIAVVESIKINEKDNGTAYINAFHLNVIGRAQIEASEIFHRMAKKFYEKNHAALPAAQTSGIAVQLGIDKKIGDVSSFPIDLLESSASVENNGGQWPSEIEEMAAGLVTDGPDDVELNAMEPFEEYEVVDDSVAGPSYT